MQQIHALQFNSTYYASIKRHEDSQESHPIASSHLFTTSSTKNPFPFHVKGDYHPTRVGLGWPWGLGGNFFWTNFWVSHYINPWYIIYIIYKESAKCDKAKILQLEQDQLPYIFRKARKCANFLLARYRKAEIRTGMVDHTLVNGRKERLGQSAFNSAGPHLEEDNWAEFFYLNLYLQLEALQVSQSVSYLCSHSPPQQDLHSAPALPSSLTLSERSIGSEHSIRSWISAGSSYHGILGPMELGKVDRSNVDNAQWFGGTLV